MISQHCYTHYSYSEVGSTVYKSTAVLRLILGSLKVFFASIATCFCFSYRLQLQSSFLITVVLSQIDICQT